MLQLRNRIVLLALLIAACASNKTPAPAQVSEPGEPAEASLADASVSDAFPSCGSSWIGGGTVDKTKLGERCSIRGDAGLTFTDCPPGMGCIGFGGVNRDDPDLDDYRCVPTGSGGCELVTCPSSPHSCCVTFFSAPPIVACYGDTPDVGDGGSR